MLLVITLLSVPEMDIEEGEYKNADFRESELLASLDPKERQDSHILG